MGGPHSNTTGVKDITIYPFELRNDIIKVGGLHVSFHYCDQGCGFANS